MELLESLTVYHAAQPRTIELYHGDLTDLTQEEAVDILVVSAFPYDYSPTPGTLIDALYDKGISVADLAADKEVDPRRTCSCWLSRDVVSAAGATAGFKRILCFEPLVRGTPPEVVGDIFRSLVPFLGDDASPAALAMPLVASGNQASEPARMLESLLDAAVHWMALGINLGRLKIVERDPQKAAALRDVFSRWKSRCDSFILGPPERFLYDVFISYAHKDADATSTVVDALRDRRPDLRIFIDQKELNPGAAWQQEIYEALDACRNVITLYSPAYLDSKVCLEELNIALLRHRESARPVLFPIYLRSAAIPSYMRLVQYSDCREADGGRVRAACEQFLSTVGH